MIPRGLLSFALGSILLTGGYHDGPAIRSGPLPRRRARRVEAPAPPQGPETRQQRRHRERQAAKVTT